MDEIEALKEKLYNEALDGEYRRFKYRKDHDEFFTITELETMLNTEYKYHDDDWVGRGGLHMLEGQARIAALEILLEEWKREIREKGSK